MLLVIRQHFSLLCLSDLPTLPTPTPAAFAIVCTASSTTQTSPPASQFEVTGASPFMVLWRSNPGPCGTSLNGAPLDSGSPLDSVSAGGGTPGSHTASWSPTWPYGDSRCRGLPSAPSCRTVRTSSRRKSRFFHICASP